MLNHICRLYKENTKNKTITVIVPLLKMCLAVTAVIKDIKIAIKRVRQIFLDLSFFLFSLSFQSVVIERTKIAALHDMICPPYSPGPPSDSVGLNLFCSFNEPPLECSVSHVSCGGRLPRTAAPLLLLPHVALLVALPGLCGQPVQRHGPHLLYNSV